MRKNSNITKLVMSAILAAISIVLTRGFSIMITPDMRIGIGSLPIILAGLLFGPRYGGLTGFVADIVGIMINPMGSAIHLGFTLSSVLTGFIPGFINFNVFEENKRNTFMPIFISILLVYLGVHLGLNSLWLSQLYGKSMLVLIPVRFLKVAIEGVIAQVLLVALSEKIAKKVRV